MASSTPIQVPRAELANLTRQPKPFGITTPLLFGAVAVLSAALYDWPRRWALSGAAQLTFCIILGSSKGYRILPFVPLWTLITTLNLVYAVAATSWLLYGFFLVGCYPTIFLTCLFQFRFVADFVRGSLRQLLKQFQFVNDTISIFNIPALEIDTDVDGLMVIRGLTVSLSTLTIVAHGVEVGIKLSDDLELAIQTEKVTIPLFRRIQIEDCFANLKGGTFEMTFGDMADMTNDSDGDAVMVEDTPLLKAAAAQGDMSRPKMVKMTSRMTDGSELQDSSASSGFGSATKISSDDIYANEQYQNTLDWIRDSNAIHQCRERIKKRVKQASEEDMFDFRNEKNMRAAICSQLHDKPSVPHPPKRSIKVTTIQNLSPPWLRRLLHRLPLLLRILLNPISYFHPVYISSVTAAGSGQWITHVLKQKLFKQYGEESSEIRRLEEKVSSWLSDANFAFELADITGLAQVPISSAFDIVCTLAFKDVMAYRTLPREVNLKQVVRLGGADATFSVPTFLLPHHEHLLPPIPTPSAKEELRNEAQNADGLPQTVHKEHDLKRLEKDEANVKISAHVRLPACFDQELLNFISALVKASKVVELEKAPSAMDEEVSGFRDFTQSLHKGVKESVKRAAIDGILNESWIAKMVGKVTKKLETAQGDVGYSGDIPVPLIVYRLPEGHPEQKKLLA